MFSCHSEHLPIDVVCLSFPKFIVFYGTGMPYA